jgi:hypothetical protein
MPRFAGAPSAVRPNNTRELPGMLSEAYAGGNEVYRTLRLQVTRVRAGAA